jgi:hypothetical protein
MAYQTCGIAGHQAMVGNVSSHDRSCSDERPASYDDTGQQHAAGTDSCTPSDDHPRRRPVVRAFENAVWGHGSRESIVGHHDARSQEDAILQDRWSIHRHEILQLAVVADEHSDVDVDPFAQDAK